MNEKLVGFGNSNKLCTLIDVQIWDILKAKFQIILVDVHKGTQNLVNAQGT